MSGDVPYTPDAISFLEDTLRRLQSAERQTLAPHYTVKVPEPSESLRALVRERHTKTSPVIPGIMDGLWERFLADDLSPIERHARETRQRILTIAFTQPFTSKADAHLADWIEEVMVSPSPSDLRRLGRLMAARLTDPTLPKTFNAISHVLRRQPDSHPVPGWQRLTMGLLKHRDPTRIPPAADPIRRPYDGLPRTTARGNLGAILFIQEMRRHLRACTSPSVERLDAILDTLRDWNGQGLQAWRETNQRSVVPLGDKRNDGILRSAAAALLAAGADGSHRLIARRGQAWSDVFSPLIASYDPRALQERLPKLLRQELEDYLSPRHFWKISRRFDPVAEIRRWNIEEILEGFFMIVGQIEFDDPKSNRLWELRRPLLNDLRPLVTDVCITTRRLGPWFNRIREQGLMPVPIVGVGQYYFDQVFLILRLQGPKGVAIYVEPAGGGKTLIFRSDLKTDPFLASEQINYYEMRQYAESQGISISHFPSSWASEVRRYLQQTIGV